MRVSLPRSAGRGQSEPPALAEVAHTLDNVLEMGDSGLLLDFDGTLAPIVAQPERAQCPFAVRSAIGRLVTRLNTVAVVSGREVGDLSVRVPVPGIWLVGSHGAVIRRPSGQEVRIAVSDDLVARVTSLVVDLTDLSGVRVEPKGTAVAFHYRGQEHDANLVATLRSRVTAAAESIGLVVGEGRCVLEARVPGIDKGAALDRIVEETGLRAVVVAGDDWTDLDAFRAAHRHPECRGIAIAVGSPEMPAPLRTEADVLAAGVDEVGDWLISLAPG